MNLSFRPFFSITRKKKHLREIRSFRYFIIFIPFPFTKLEKKLEKEFVYDFAFSKTKGNKNTEIILSFLCFFSGDVGSAWPYRFAVSLPFTIPGNCTVCVINELVYWPYLFSSLHLSAIRKRFSVSNRTDTERTSFIFFSPFPYPRCTRLTSYLLRHYCSEEREMQQLRAHCSQIDLNRFHFALTNMNRTMFR